MKEKVNVTGVPETMVQTLYARAKETRKKNAKINDEIAEELMKNLDYDFSKADKDKAMNYGVIARTIVLDRMVEQYLEKNANTIVINIACGLDTRCYRMKGKYLHWYNIDLPETMKIRRQFLPETGPIYQIAKSAMDDSYVDDIDYHCENVLVIIELVATYAAHSTGITASRLRLYPQGFFSILFPVPPRKEQQEIAVYLNKKIPQIDQLIIKKEKFVDELKSYKRSLIYEYVTGKKEVPEF